MCPWRLRNSEDNIGFTIEDQIIYFVVNHMFQFLLNYY